MMLMAMAMGKKDLIHKTLPKEYRYLIQPRDHATKKNVFFVLNMVPPPPPPPEKK